MNSCSDVHCKTFVLHGFCALWSSDACSLCVEPVAKNGVVELH